MKLKDKLLIAFGSLLLSAAVYADEGRIDITGPTTITAPGSYILVNDIVATFTGIYIDSSNVKLDLNGFTISHAGANVGDGVTILPRHKNIEVTNGAITGMTRHGVFVPGSADSRNIKISRLRVSDNAISGIRMENNPGFIIEGCLVSFNGTGISAYKSGLVLNNVVSNNKTGLFGVAFGADRLGYRSNVLFNNSVDVSGGTNLGENLCSGALCP